MSAEPVALGVDLGGSAVKWGLVDATGRILEDDRVPLDNRSPDAVIEIVSSIIRRARDQATSAIRGVGIGSPGLIDKAQRVVRTSPNFPAWRDVPLADRLQEAAGLIPVFLENDANVVVYNEHRWYAAQDEVSFLVLTLGTGVGGGVMVEGRLLRGVGGGAGELGHVQLNPEGPLCGCGAKGCLETYCNITGVMRAAGEVFPEQEAPGDPQELSQLAQAGDQYAVEVWRRTGVWLGRGLAVFVNIFNPARILIGGGLAGAGEWLLEPARRTLREIAYTPNVEDCTVQSVDLGSRAGLSGAAAMVFELNRPSA